MKMDSATFQQSAPDDEKLVYPPEQTFHKINMENTEPMTGSYVPLKNPGHRFEKPWTPGPTGFEAGLLEPPRYELRELKEHIMFADYEEQENCVGVASKLTRTYGHRFWSEFYMILMPIVDFAFALVLETLGFVMRAVMHLLLGILVRISDYVFKPLLTVLFNAFAIPSLTHANAVLAAVVRMVQPVMGLAESVANIFAIPIRAFRLIENSKHKHGKPFNV